MCSRTGRIPRCLRACRSALGVGREALAALPGCAAAVWLEEQLIVELRLSLIRGHITLGGMFDLVLE